MRYSDKTGKIHKVTECILSNSIELGGWSCITHNIRIEPDYHEPDLD